jgi:hypothetical protein
MRAFGHHVLKGDESDMRDMREKRSEPPGRVARLIRRRGVVAIAVAAAAALAAVPVVSASSSPGPAKAVAAADKLGLKPGKIKHVWLIILENKSYDASFTGLNNNTYLWKTLPSQGVLLKNYFGTGHFSLDNYVAMVSGQATQPDTQADCPYYDKFTGSVDLQGKLTTNPRLRVSQERAYAV